MRKLTPLGLAFVILACIIVSVVVFAGTAILAGENPMTVLTGPSETSISEVIFHDNGMIRVEVGGGAEIRLATIVDSERAVAVSCPPGFNPDTTRTYVAEPYQLETVDGRITPTVWVLRPNETMNFWREGRFPTKVTIK